jgi:hypothetical protein
MKHVNVYLLAALLGVASPAFATNNGVGNECQGNSCGAQGGAGGAGGAGGHADATAVGVGGSASNRTDVDVDASTRSSATSVSGASSRQGQLQGQQQGQEQSNSQGISAFNGNTTTVEAPDVKGMGKELAKHASSSAEVRSDSKGGDSPCGDSTGLSAQAGLGGAGFATTSETCKAFRLQRLQATDNGSVSTTLAQITYFVGFPFRLVLHVASFGVLN